MTIGSATPGFAHDIKPLFREEDRDAMEYVFDLWEYNDVRDQVDNILERLEDGSMPCDGERLDRPRSSTPALCRHIVL
jgi:hypothetical protein